MDPNTCGGPPIHSSQSEDHQLYARAGHGMVLVCCFSFAQCIHAQTSMKEAKLAYLYSDCSILCNSLLFSDADCLVLCCCGSACSAASDAAPLSTSGGGSMGLDSGCDIPNPSDDITPPSSTL